jgi:benzoyl-CoA reductase subunit A
MRYSLGVDLGSTTTMAFILDEKGDGLGRGITNSRSNYDVACEVALGEALINTRLSLVTANLDALGMDTSAVAAQMTELEAFFREQQYRSQLELLGTVMRRMLAASEPSTELVEDIESILALMTAETASLYTDSSSRKSDFFRDLAGSRFLKFAEAESREASRARGRGSCSGIAGEGGTATAGPSLFDRLVGVYDKAILKVENTPSTTLFGEIALGAVGRMAAPDTRLEQAVQEAAATELEQVGSVGTGYGRQRLPFPEGSIRSEILCHGLGAHAMFPGTRTVLDIGGQDTKAIQVDEQGIVTSFQMNDRCAAGCGRYLGYIADEMNLGLHELGPLAVQSERPARINSTCTVFAGSELRERLSLGERREDILAGLHRAIIVRAMSLLARSGGVNEQFTFTGGVARNTAAVEALQRLVQENYGEVTMNISADSIYTGALGAALFALRGATAPQPESVPS